MTDRETSVLLDGLAAQVPVGRAPTAQLLRAGRRARRRRAAGVTLAVAAGAAVLVGGTATVLDLGGAQPAPLVVAEETLTERPESTDDRVGSAMAAEPENPTADRTGPLAGSVTASCVEEYSAEAVRGRAFAFDGVVVAIGPSGTDRSDIPGPELAGVTFAVQEWFSGGSGESVTVDLPASTSAEQWTSSEQGPEYGIGSRLLVSGEDRWEGPPLEPIGWACGFTRYHDEATAASWR
ncbi:hypothetical protein [Blastococcus saxobsidens]|uniref:Uncharacterized protein n=1 Tax=Blastococcus saxobsidens TaxID=138336 RepID=A0A4Q7YCM7_9ACTN|nr:hypothetical protein [Blastococcus saxobsidens]RZU33979.1 hypothetical protein BKA19_3728 [Blastococcus saxobsidens]